MTVGEKIYTLRTRAGYSQEEFAELIGVSRQSVSKWETSSVMPDTEYVVQICKILSVSTDTLLLDEELPSADIPLRSMSEEAQHNAIVQQQSPLRLDNSSRHSLIFKRVLLGVTVGIYALLVCMAIYYLWRFVMLWKNEMHTISDYVVIMSYTSNLTNAVCAICHLAIWDFVFYLGRKRYNAGMLGIVFALFAFSVVGNLTSSFVMSLFDRIMTRDIYTGFAYFLIYRAYVVTANVALAIAYLAVKCRYLKTHKTAS